MKRIVAFVILAISLSSCFTKGNVARVTASPEPIKGKPLRVLVLPFATEGNPDVPVSTSNIEPLSGGLMQLGLIPVDAQAAAMKAGMQNLSPLDMTNPDVISKLAAASNIDLLAEGTVRFDYVPPTSGTTPATYEKTHNDSTKRTSVKMTSGGNYATGGFFTEREVSMRLVDARTGNVMVTALVNDKDLTGYFNTDVKYQPIDEIVEALKRDLK